MLVPLIEETLGSIGMQRCPDYGKDVSLVRKSRMEAEAQYGRCNALSLHRTISRAARRIVIEI